MMENNASVLIADDHEMIREGLAHSIGELDGNFRILTASNGAEVIAQLDSGQPFALIILDLFMPDTDGFTLVSEVCERLPDTPVVVLSGSEETAHMHRVIDAGAAGFIPKTHGRTLMLGALRLVLSGGTYIPPHMLEMQHDDAEADAETVMDITDTGPVRRKPSLTRRQREILELLARGQSNKQVARSLGLSEHTVKAHIRTIFKELKASNRTQAVMAAQHLDADTEHAPGTRDD